jgi:hypothetical protein
VTYQAIENDAILKLEAQGSNQGKFSGRKVILKKN